ADNVPSSPRTEPPWTCRQRLAQTPPKQTPAGLPLGEPVPGPQFPPPVTHQTTAKHDKSPSICKRAPPIVRLLYRRNWPPASEYQPPPGSTPDPPASA